MSYETGLSKNRIKALTDAVFAVVMTLLVLEISILQISSDHAATGGVAAIGPELLKRLLDLWPKILSFGISFIVLAIYWMAHHRQFRYIKNSDHRYFAFNGGMLQAISRLVDENLDPVIKTTSLRRLVFGIIVYLFAIGISAVYIHLSIFIFALILIPAFLPNKTMHRITFGGLTKRIE